MPELWGPDLLTDWARPHKDAYGGIPDNGDFRVPEVGASVTVMFEAGNPNRPVYGPVWWGMPSSEQEGGGKKPVPEPPKLARGEGDESTRAPKGTDRATAADGEELEEPGSPFAAAYPQNKVTKTKDNAPDEEAPHPAKAIILELDDTIDEDGNPQKRIHSWHPTGTYDEVAPDGSRRVRVQSDRFTVVVGKDQVHIQGRGDVVIDGDATLKVGGNLTILVKGDVKRTIEGNLDETVKGDVTRSIEGSLTESVGGARSFSVGGKDERNVGGKIVDQASGGIEHS